MGFAVTAAYNRATGPTPNEVVVNFPAAGVFPFELDYTECCGDGLVLTLTANGHPIGPAAPLTGPLLPLAVVGGAIAFARRRQLRSRESEKLRTITQCSVVVTLEVLCPRELTAKILASDF